MQMSFHKQASLHKYATINATTQDDELRGAYLKLHEEKKILLKHIARLEQMLKHTCQQKINAEQKYIQLYCKMYGL